MGWLGGWVALAVVVVAVGTLVVVRETRTGDAAPSVAAEPDGRGRAQVWGRLEREFLWRAGRGDWRTWDVADVVADRVGADLGTVFEFCAELDRRRPAMKFLRERDLRRCHYS